MIEKLGIKGITADSRHVRLGYLFAALPPVRGGKIDGRDYIEDAIKNGASAILTKTGTPKPESPDSKITFLTDEHPRRAYAKACAEFYQKQPEHIIAVTGTNGKTSVVNFVRQIWEAMGIKAASMGTLGVTSGDYNIDGSMTTPDPALIHKHLAEMCDHDITHLALEASSHGLDQDRLAGVNIQAGGFTNLSQDHLDYHTDMESYFQAKSRLFTEVLSKHVAPKAVINEHTSAFEQIKTITQERFIKLFGYHADMDGGYINAYEGGQTTRLLSLQDVKITPQGFDLSIKSDKGSYDIRLPLTGHFQLQNVLCALGLVYSIGTDEIDNLIPLLSHLTSVRGRMEAVAGHRAGAGIYVDYAHTPDAIKTALVTLKPHVSGKLICIFGCGGDRDKTKRPLMAAAAAAHADIAILTDDNPRSEDPARIRADALKGAPDILEIAGRRDAIHHALRIAQKGDIVLIAGKGHEQGQEISGIKHPFDDVSVAKEEMETL